MGHEAVPHSGARCDGDADMKIYNVGDVARILWSNFNVNSGFVVEHDGKTFHGARAFHYPVS